MTMIDAARSDEIYAEMGSGDRDLGRFGGEHRGGRRVVRRARPRTSAASPTTRSARSSPTTCAASACTSTRPLATDGSPTGRCLVIVTPDADRTLCTFLGAGAELDESYIDEALVESSAVTYLEGYIWDPPAAKEAVRLAASIAHRADRRVALTLSDPFCVERHREEFVELIANDIDILFANEDEITSLYQVDDVRRGVAPRARTLRHRGAHARCAAAR